MTSTEHAQMATMQSNGHKFSPAGSMGAAPLAVAGRPGGSLATTGNLSVQVCGRLVTVPADAATSLAMLTRHLTQQLKMSGQSSLQFADVAGKRINGDLELSAALREGRHPLQASMTVSALREIEQKKSEVETKKEELAQFQWQVVVDQIAQVSQQVTAVTNSLQTVKDECQELMQRARAEESMRTERMEEAITRETQQREMGLKDVETKIDKLVQAIYAEKSARDVSSHQLASQLETAVGGIEADRALRAQERAEMERLYDAVKHQVDAEQARNEEQWNWHMETAKRLDARLEERASADLQQQMRLSEVEASAERLRATIASVEGSLAMTQRTMQELMTRRQEELSKAVRDEMVGRENHIARFAKELETSWQSLEARLQRCREEASSATAGVTERVRVLEDRCAEVEKDLTNHVTAQCEHNHILNDKVHNSETLVSSLEVNLKSSDVVTQTTVSRVDELLDRMVSIEDECRSKVRADYWQPQMDALQRADHKFETKLAQVEKDLLARLQAESCQRDGLKSQLQETLKTCMDKIIASKPTREGNRFIEVPVASPTSDDGGGLLTPRCAFGGQTGPGTGAIQIPGVRGTIGVEKAAPQVARQISMGGSMSPSAPRPVFVQTSQPVAAMSYGTSPQASQMYTGSMRASPLRQSQ